VSAELARGTPAAGGGERQGSTLHIEVVFRDLDERRSHAIAAEMVSRAHELANLPESECDVDVSIRVGAGEGGARDEASG
jgi:hypothetical protein